MPFVLQLHIAVAVSWLALLAQGLKFGRTRRDDDFDSLQAKFSTGIKECIEAHKLDPNRPIVVTEFGSNFDGQVNDIAVMWAERCRNFSIQHLMIALTQDSVTVARSKGLPGIAVDGECILATSATKDGLPKTDTGRRIPHYRPGLQFLVPALLMDKGFSRVLFSGMDVFFFENPFEATRGFSGSLLIMQHTPILPESGGQMCMDNPKDFHMDLGFMEFHQSGSSELVKVLLNIAELKGRDVHHVSEASSFNNVIQQHQAIERTYLPVATFAVRPECITKNTKVVRITGIPWVDEMNNLKKLYAGEELPPKANHHLFMWLLFALFVVVCSFLIVTRS